MSLTNWKDFDDIFRDDFGFGLWPSDLLTVDFREMERKARESFAGEIMSLPSSTGQNGFQVCMDTRNFSPNEITVTANDNWITIKGNHEERQDEHGYISRHFKRRYVLPSGFDSNTITSELSSDGILTVKAPLPKALENKNERYIAIQQTGSAHFNMKENKAIVDSKSKL